MAPSSLASQCRLEPIKLQDADQFEEMRQQRIACGWFYDTPTIQEWREKQEENLKSLFWITVPNVSDGMNMSVHVGHVALNAYGDPPKVGLGRADKSVLSISSLFILPEYSAQGLGRRVMELLEEVAAVEPYGSPHCRFLALTALSKRHLYDEGPQWRGIWERLGSSPPRFCVQEWYERLGYVGWKEEWLYEEQTPDGEVVKLMEVFMRKEL